jgi:hypothetical protein
MECAECGETVPNNMCEFIDEDMECCMCLPCVKTFREWQDDFENRGGAILCEKMRPVIEEAFRTHRLEVVEAYKRKLQELEII